MAALSVRTTASGASLAAHHEMAASILMDVALLPETPRHAADTNLAAGLVQVSGALGAAVGAMVPAGG